MSSLLAGQRVPPFLLTPEITSKSLLIRPGPIVEDISQIRETHAAKLITKVKLGINVNLSLLCIQNLPIKKGGDYL